jgi:hypothetical protein
MPQRTTRILGYSRALPDIRVEGKVTPRQVLRRLAVACWASRCLPPWPTVAVQKAMRAPLRHSSSR